MKMAEVKRAQEEQAQRQAAMARLSQDPRFAGLPPELLQIDPKTAITRAFPEPQKPQFVDTVDAQGRPVKKAVVPEAGAALPGYRAELDPSVRQAKVDTAVQMETALQPLKLEQRRAGKTDVVVQPDNLGLKPKDRFDMEDKLRNDFQSNPTVKAADEMKSAFKLIETAYQRPSAANDLAMATKYMKILDPTSVVRESEFALAVNATGLLDKVQNYAASVLEGKKLNPTQRKDFYESAKEISDAFQKERGGIAERFTENAKQYNLTPDNVVGSPRQAQKQDDPMPSKPPAAKHRGRIIEDSTGKRFKSDGMGWRPL
jgi:hypothetical protein